MYACMYVCMYIYIYIYKYICIYIYIYIHTHTSLAMSGGWGRPERPRGKGCVDAFHPASPAARRPGYSKPEILSASLFCLAREHPSPGLIF